MAWLNLVKSPGKFNDFNDIHTLLKSLTKEEIDNLREHLKTIFNAVYMRNNVDGDFNVEDWHEYPFDQDKYNSKSSIYLTLHQVTSGFFRIVRTNNCYVSVLFQDEIDLTAFALAYKVANRDQ